MCTSYLLRLLEIILGFNLLAHLLQATIFVAVISAQEALKDAPDPEDGSVPFRPLGNDWIILRKRMTWGNASVECDLEHYRLAMLPTIEKVKELVQAIKSISVQFTQAYDKLYRAEEFGMDRRYWIGLTDQVEENIWTWTHNGSEVDYDFWYPGQPDHQDKINNKGQYKVDWDREHCVALWNPGYYLQDTHTFNDEPCKKLYYAICDKSNPSLEADTGASIPNDPGVSSAASSSALQSVPVTITANIPPTKDKKPTCKNVKLATGMARVCS